MPPLALVAENDSGTQRLLSVLLSRAGYEVDALACGSDARSLLAEIRYDLAVLDLCLPCTSGEEVLEWIRANRPADLSRAVMLSSAPLAVERELRDAFPQVRLLRKPFDIADIVEAAEKAKPSDEREALSSMQQFARRSVTAGAKAGVLVRNSGSSLALVHAFGYSADALAGWFPLRVSELVPLTTCVRDGRPHWFESLKEAARAYPRLEPVWRRNGSNAVASVPVMRDGVVIGAAGWTFREPQVFDAAAQSAFSSIAAEAAAVIQSATGAGA